jgi:pilus assembly protein CpaC
MKLVTASILLLASACELFSRQAEPPAQPTSETHVIVVSVNKSTVLEHARGLRRVSIANGDFVEAVAVSATELLLNGKMPGETNLILWDAKGVRTMYEVHVTPDNKDLDAIRDQLAREVGTSATVDFSDKTAYLRGTVSDPIAADRAAAIVAPLGKVVNLLRVKVPASAPQILLKVRFATINRSEAQQLGFNFLSMNQKGVANVTTTQFGSNPQLTSPPAGATSSFTDLLNIFYYRPDLNIGTYIQALEAKNILQILAEPNLLTVSGEQASFLAGGEFPFPTIQGGAAGVGQVTIQFKEFGIRLNFTPVVTPRGSILLKVNPEVSSLDYSNGLTVNGFTVPGLASRRVQTEVELDDGQSFVIAGLLDKQVTEQLNKIPGLASVPLLGKLFQSKSLQQNDTELLIVVTPELVGPIPSNSPVPNLKLPLPFSKGTPDAAPRNPVGEGSLPPNPIQKVDTLPIEMLNSLPLPQNTDQGNGANNKDALPIQPNPGQPSPPGASQQPGSNTAKP